MEKKQTEEQKKQLQQKYMEMQLLDQQMKQIQQQLQAIEQQAMEADEVQQNLDQFGKSKVDSKLLVPVSSGIFIRAKLEDNEKLAVNVGANTIVNKTIPETKDLLNNQVNEMRKVQQELAAQFEKFAMRAAELEQEMQTLLGA